MINGAPVGYALNVSRDLGGLKECKRKTYPSIVKNLNDGAKKLLFGGLILSSIALTDIVYDFYDEINSIKDNIIELFD